MFERTLINTHKRSHRVTRNKLRVTTYWYLLISSEATRIHLHWEIDFGDNYLTLTWPRFCPEKYSGTRIGTHRWTHTSNWRAFNMRLRTRICKRHLARSAPRPRKRDMIKHSNVWFLFAQPCVWLVVQISQQNRVDSNWTRSHNIFPTFGLNVQSTSHIRYTASDDRFFPKCQYEIMRFAIKWVPKREAFSRFDIDFVNFSSIRMNQYQIQ